MEMGRVEGFNFIDGFTLIDRRPPRAPKAHQTRPVFKQNVLYLALRGIWDRV